jgi:hypothetical protein
MRAMRLDRPFLKLPIAFEADALAAEVRALPPAAWTPHPTGFVGNEAVRLVTPEGEPSDEIQGRMRPTSQLEQCPFIRQIMGEIGAVWGRSRLMGLAPGSDVPPHVDTNYYWRTHLRIHIPVVTNPGVLFTCGEETVHMAAGECWLFDSFRWHKVENRGSERRVHLVLDTVGGGLLPELIASARKGSAQVRNIKPHAGAAGALAFEQVNSPRVMSPWEMRCHLAFLIEQAVSDPLLEPVVAAMEAFIDGWAAAWAQFGEDEAGRSTYARLLQDARRRLGALGGERIALTNRWPLYQMFEQMIFQVALARPSGAPLTAGSMAQGLRPAAYRASAAAR